MMVVDVINIKGPNDDGDDAPRYDKLWHYQIVIFIKVVNDDAPWYQAVKYFLSVWNSAIKKIVVFFT